MVGKRKFVAILTSSPALGSIIAMVLDCEEHLNVQTFSRVETFTCHTRIAPVDLLIVDYEINQTIAPQLALDLRRANPNRHFQFIVLTDYMDEISAQACKFAGIDEVIAKPMSPLFVRDRVIARLDKVKDQDVVRQQANGPAPIASDNIVHLYAKDSIPSINAT